MCVSEIAKNKNGFFVCLHHGGYFRGPCSSRLELERDVEADTEATLAPPPTPAPTPPRKLQQQKVAGVLTFTAAAPLISPTLRGPPTGFPIRGSLTSLRLPQDPTPDKITGFRPPKTATKIQGASKRA
jgi:hypothetical protein